MRIDARQRRRVGQSDQAEPVVVTVVDAASKLIIFDGFTNGLDGVPVNPGDSIQIAQFKLTAATGLPYAQTELNILESQDVFVTDAYDNDYNQIPLTGNTNAFDTGKDVHLNYGVAPVPEPSSFALLALGTVGALVMRRRLSGRRAS